MSIEHEEERRTMHFWKSYNSNSLGFCKATICYGGKSFIGPTSFRVLGRRGGPVSVVALL